MIVKDKGKRVRMYRFLHFFLFGFSLFFFFFFFGDRGGGGGGVYFNTLIYLYF